MEKGADWVPLRETIADELETAFRSEARSAGFRCSSGLETLHQEHVVAGAAVQAWPSPAPVLRTAHTDCMPRLPRVICHPVLAGRQTTLCIV